MKQFFTFLLIACVFFAKAQNSDTMKLIGIHPAVGKTIERAEKTEYHLFTDYSDSLFDYAQVFRQNDTTFRLVITSIGGTQKTYKLDTTAMNNLYDRIDDVEQAKLKDGDYADDRKQKKHPHADFWYDFLEQAIYITLDVLIALI